MKRILACLACVTLLSGCYTALETTADDRTADPGPPILIAGDAPPPPPETQPVIVVVPVIVGAPVQAPAPAPEPVRTFGSTRGTQEQGAAAGGTSRDTGSHRRP